LFARVTRRSGTIDVMLRRAIALAFVVTALLACRQEETNGPCGSLVKPLCATPMECVAVASPEMKQMCVKPCRDTTLDCPPPGCCPAGSSCRPVDLVSKRVATSELPSGVGYFCIPDSPPSQ
jgi:hypothetical protein